MSLLSQKMKLGFTIPPILQIKKDKIKKIPWVLASHAFLVILICIALFLLASMALFWQYILVVKNQVPEGIAQTTEFEYNAYEKILKEWETKERIFQETSDINYINPFKVQQSIK